MSEPTLQVLASRQLLQEVCVLLAPFADDAVLIGGWVPEIRFPDAHPEHVGSIDVDFAMRADKARHAAVVSLLTQNGFRQGKEPYQFLKDTTVAGKAVVVTLDLLTSPAHHAAAFADTKHAPFPAPGTELAFVNNSIEKVGTTEVRVASVVALVVMKAHAIQDREKAKDAYDLNFCIQNFPGGIASLAVEFSSVMADTAVREILAKLGDVFRDEEDRGPRDVVEVEGPLGEARAIRKFDVFTRVDDFLRAIGVRQ